LQCSILVLLYWCIRDAKAFSIKLPVIHQPSLDRCVYIYYNILSHSLTLNRLSIQRDSILSVCICVYIIYITRFITQYKNNCPLLLRYTFIKYRFSIYNRTKRKQKILEDLIPFGWFFSLYNKSKVRQMALDFLWHILAPFHLGKYILHCRALIITDLVRTLAGWK